MKRKNIAIICLSEINGGMELSAIKIANLLAEEVNVHFISKKNSFIEKNRKNNFSSKKISIHTVSFKSSFSLSLIKDVRKILIEKEIKNLLFLGASEIKSLYFSTLNLDINFLIRQGSTKKTSKKDFLHKFFYSKVNYFIGNSNYMKKNIIDILPIPKCAKIKTIYASTKLPETIIQKELTNKIKLIHVGRISRGKGQLEAIKACEILYKENTNFSLKIIGSKQDEDYFDEIQTYLNKCKFKDKVDFLGHSHNIEKYLKESDIFIFPSLGEGMSNSVIEALSNGLVTIVYNNTSLPEFLNLGFYIHLVNNKDENELKKTLKKIVLNLKKEKKNSLKNFYLSKKIFSKENEKNSYLKLLK